MKLRLEREDAELIVQMLVERLHPKGAAPEQSSPVNDLDNWIRAEDLHKRKLFSKSTLHRYYNEGRIGKSTLGGLSFFYIPDIVGLLEAAHIKKEVAAGIGKILRERTRNGKH